jgi:hypothetical protein
VDSLSGLPINIPRAVEECNAKRTFIMTKVSRKIEIAKFAFVVSETDKRVGLGCTQRIEID